MAHIGNKNLSSNNSLKIITQKVLPPPPCSLALCSPFLCPSGSYGWQLHCSSVNHQCLKYFTQMHSLPVMRLFPQHSPHDQQCHTAPAYRREVRLAQPQVGRAASTTQASLAPQTLCFTEPCIFYLQW